MKKDILKEEFEKEIEIPESLSKNNIIKMLQEKDIKPDKKVEINILPKILSAAAMLLIVIIAAISLNLRSEFVDVEMQNTPTTTTASALTTSADVPENKEEKATAAAQITEAGIKENAPQPTNLKVAKSEKDLKNHFVKMYTEGKINNYIDTVFNYASDILLYGLSDDKSADALVGESINMAPSMAITAAPQAEASRGDSATSTVPHGTTNVQVADVDEGDIIKNDGKYLYIVNHPGNKISDTNGITIVDTETMKRVYRGKIELKDSEVLEKIKENSRLEKYHGDLTTDMFIQDIYLDGDILTAICTYNEKTYAVIYDISKRHAPAEVRRFDQDGSYVSSRMVNGIIYTVTSYTVRGSSVEEVEKNSIPQVNCDCIPYSKCYMLDEDSTRYIVVSAFDTSKPHSTPDAISVLGDGFEIYSTAENLYVYSTDYDNIYGDNNAIVKTIVNSFSLNGTEITHKATGTFNGTCLNQYSFDEYKGNLRVAACYYNPRTNEDVSCVYVLNEELEIIGELTDIAKDEQVKAVRFMGDTGYVVTFRNTDPLFIIDFSDPEKPKITGELKIPGYSTYIHPIADGYLVGIGYDGTAEDVKTNTVKVSVFDVRDKTAPKETDTFVIKDAFSLVNENPKAFFFYSEKNMIGIPVSHYRDGNTVKSIQTLTIEDGKIKDHLGYIHHTTDSKGYNITFYGYHFSELFRGTYIGNMLYTIGNYEIIEHNLDTGDKERSCIIVSEEDMENTSTGVSVETTDGIKGVITATTTPPTK
ncbi:MAG: beta-propeller domain-containing protein [Clostridia bacterium]|nr:beta-propeller domain-containing protein [Clostridia bacterium]